MGWISAVVGLATSAYGAYSTSKASKKASQEADNANAMRAMELQQQQANLDRYYEELQTPAEIYAELLRQFPDLLNDLLPPLTSQAIQTSSRLTDSNVANWRKAVTSMFPNYFQIQGDIEKQVGDMNPDNMGANELLAITRKAAPFIPTGTVDEKTGAIKGGATSPTALYRNLISEEYGARRNQYIGAAGALVDRYENSAVRQQERASTFLSQFLNMASGAAATNTQLGVAQQSEIGRNQTSMLSSLMATPMASFDSAGYTKAMNDSMAGIITNIGALAKGYSSGGWGTGSASSTGSGYTNR